MVVISWVCGAGGSKTIDVGTHRLIQSSQALHGSLHSLNQLMDTLTDPSEPILRSHHSAKNDNPGGGYMEGNPESRSASIHAISDSEEKRKTTNVQARLLDQEVAQAKTQVHSFDDDIAAAQAAVKAAKLQEDAVTSSTSTLSHDKHLPGLPGREDMLLPKIPDGKAELEQFRSDIIEQREETESERAERLSKKAKELMQKERERKAAALEPVPHTRAQENAEQAEERHEVIP